MGRAITGAALGTVAIVALDQVTKHLVVRRYSLGEQTRLIGPLRLIRVANRGMAFGRGGGFGGVAFIAALLIILMVVVGWRQASRGRGGSASLLSGLVFGAVLGGALGNLVDRVFRSPGRGRGAVVDFIDIGPWPVFNVADAALTLGCLWFAFRSLRAGADRVDRPPRAPGRMTIPKRAGE